MNIKIKKVILIKVYRWQEQSTPLERIQEQRHQENILPTRQAKERLQPHQDRRDLTDSDQEPLPWEKSEDSKNRLNFWSENYRSKDSLEKSQMTLKPIWDSNPPPSLLFKKPLRHTWLAFSKIPISVLFTRKEWPSCQRTCNSLEESEVREQTEDFFLHLNKILNQKK